MEKFIKKICHFANEETHHASIIENGIEFSSGKPVKFPYFRMNKKAPNFGEKFQQHIEPSGRYMIHDLYPESDRHGLKGAESGEAHFKHPLVITLTNDLDSIYGPQSWKARLSGMYGGKSGKELSTAVARDGYDGIVTVWMQNGKPSHTTEIVDLRMFHKHSGD